MTEINAVFCCAVLGIVLKVRHADCIGSWITVLREDNRAIVRAARQANKAAEWILGHLPGRGRSIHRMGAGTVKGCVIIVDRNSISAALSTADRLT